MYYFCQNGPPPLNATHAIALRYTTIAVIASVANLCLQLLFMLLYAGDYAVELSIVFATALVLPVKYVADKRFIFEFSAQNTRQDLSTFVMYSSVSVLTVAVFWGCEYGFHLIFDSSLLRYLGGAIGLALSFYLKYQLDKRFVFLPRTRPFSER